MKAEAMHFFTRRTGTALVWLVAGLITCSMASDAEPICLMYLTG